MLCLCWEIRLKSQTFGKTNFVRWENSLLITGTASGIGKAIAYRFAEAGADLELVDINDEKLKACCGELPPFKLKIGAHIIDLCKRAQIERLWAKLDGTEPDILVNNAGIYPMKDFQV